MCWMKLFLGLNSVRNIVVCLKDMYEFVNIFQFGEAYPWPGFCVNDSVPLKNWREKTEMKRIWYRQRFI